MVIVQAGKLVWIGNNSVWYGKRDKLWNMEKKKEKKMYLLEKNGSIIVLRYYVTSR